LALTIRARVTYFQFNFIFFWLIIYYSNLYYIYFTLSFITYLIAMYFLNWIYYIMCSVWEFARYKNALYKYRIRKFWTISILILSLCIKLYTTQNISITSNGQYTVWSIKHQWTCNNMSTWFLSLFSYLPYVMIRLYF